MDKIENLQLTKFIVPLRISTPIYHISPKIIAKNLALRETLRHVNSIYGHLFLCSSINMALCNNQTFFDAFFARDRLHLARAGYNVLANILHCSIHTYSTKPLQT